MRQEIRDPTVTKPENSASDASQGPDHAPKKEAAVTPTVPNYPIEPEAQASANPVSHEIVDSVLVGQSQDPARQPAARKETAGRIETKEAPVQQTSIPATSAASFAAASTNTSAAKPAEKSPEKVVERVIEVRKGGFVPTLLGGVIAAALGAGATYYAIPHLPAAWQPVPPVELPDPAAQLAAARQAGTEAANTAARAEVETARAGIVADASTAALEAVKAAIPPAGVAPQEFAAVTAELSSQSDRIAALSSALDALRNSAPLGSTAGLEGAQAEAIPALQSLVAQLRSQIDTQDQRIADLAARPVAEPQAGPDLEALSQQAAELQGQIRAAAEQAQSQIAAAQQQAEKVRQETENVGRRAQITAATAGLQTALETGGNLAGGLSDLRAAGVQPPAALTADVPALAFLQRDFDDAARAGLRASLKAESRGEGAMGAIGNFLRVQTGARSVQAKDGTDPDAILSRAGAAVRAGDMAAALGEIATLPKPGQDAMSGWTANAKRWADARAALTDLAATAN